MTKAAELAKMGEVLSNSQIGKKNIIINGAMQISQRATSATGLGASNGYFTLDRFSIALGSGDGRFTMSQSSVTDLEGFSNALKIQCTTADTSIAAGEAILLVQSIEGFNLQQLKATSTSTRAFTLSFYAKSNASRAIVSEAIFSNGTNRQISKLHTIGTSWARYTMTVPAASSTQIDNDNSNEMQINFWLHAGSTYAGGTLNDDALDSVTNANRAVGIGSIVASTDNTLEITGIQLEVGSVATPFEHRSFGEELALCQRYFSHSGDPTNNGFVHHLYLATNAYANFSFAVPMRTSPTVSICSTSDSYFYSAGADKSASAYSAQNISDQNFQHKIVHGSGTAGHAGHLDTNSGTRFYEADAEL